MPYLSADLLVPQTQTDILHLFRDTLAVVTGGILVKIFFSFSYFQLIIVVSLKFANHLILFLYS